MRPLHGSFPPFRRWLFREAQRSEPLKELALYVLDDVLPSPDALAGLLAWQEWAEAQPFWVQSAFVDAAIRYDDELTAWCVDKTTESDDGSA